MKLGVICDGISRDLAHTVDVMDEFGLEYAELQFVGEKEVGDHDSPAKSARSTRCCVTVASLSPASAAISLPA